MLQNDYTSLCTRGLKTQINKRDLKRLESAEMTIFMTNKPKLTLIDVNKQKLLPVGFAMKSNVQDGEVFTNPFDNRTHLKVIDVDYEQDRALLLVVDND